MTELKSAAPTTKDRILDAAEQLFADKGFAETSLRDITAAAGANLASVNYHFQSKDALILAVFARSVRPLNEKRLAELDALEAKAAGRPVPLEDVLRAFLRPMLELIGQPNAARLVGRMFADPGDIFEHFFKEQIAATADRFMAVMRRSLPHLPEVEMYWRLLFMAGAVGHTMAGLRKIKVVSGGRCDVSDVNALLDRLVAFLAAGFRAPVPPSVKVKGKSACKRSR